MKARTLAWAAATVALVVVAGGLIWKLGMGDTDNDKRGPITLGDVIPAPASVRPANGVFGLTSTTRIVASSEDARPVAEYLARELRSRTGYPLPVQGGVPSPDAIALVLAENFGGTPDGGDRGGDEAYSLDVTTGSVVLTAGKPAGLFWGAQTLRQLSPPRTIHNGASVPWSVPAGLIEDQPRFPYRGVMLDVARHFFTVAEVKRVIDLATLHKLNRLHLRLTDDQGWRLAIDSWPKLATVGGLTEVGGGPGGYYTKDDYREIVAYARSRFVTVIPELALPGHTNAALVAYPELACDGVDVRPYTGTAVGFSTLCASKDVTYRFLDDVLREVAELTPGELVHVGGDEAATLSADDYALIVGRIQEIVTAHGKVPMGWQENAEAKLASGAVLQFWDNRQPMPRLVEAAGAGHPVVMSPAGNAYLDMKYDANTELGLDWAGLINVETSYDWDPATEIAGVAESMILGVESPLWTETVATMKDIEFLAFPRLAATAELGWSPRSTHDWADFRDRLAAQGPRWAAMDIGFYRSPEIDWPDL